MSGRAAPRQGDVEFQRRLYSDPNPTRRALHSDRREWVLGNALKFSTPGDKVLEVGVGCGVFTEALSDAERKVTAVDINPAFLDNVRSVKSVTTHLKDATVPLGLGEHQLAICSEVLEHVPRDRSLGMLQALHDGLAPGGVLVLTTPQRYSTVELIARLFRFKPVLALARKLYGSADELGHINLLTAGQLRRQLEAAGFTAISQRRFGCYLPAVAEFGGAPGARTLKALEAAIAPVPVLRGLLWTQGWVLRKA
ncbi:MAG TPA: class I SAM-dependent methyltransferase [Sphingomicrobium sp.]